MRMVLCVCVVLKYVDLDLFMFIVSCGAYLHHIVNVLFIFLIGYYSIIQYAINKNNFKKPASKGFPENSANAAKKPNNNVHSLRTPLYSTVL